MIDTLLEYVCRRLIESESLLLMDVAETLWPVGVGFAYSQIEGAARHPAVNGIHFKSIKNLPKRFIFWRCVVN